MDIYATMPWTLVRDQIHCRNFLLVTNLNEAPHRKAATDCPHLSLRCLHDGDDCSCANNAQTSLAKDVGCHHFDVDASRENPNFVYLHEPYDDRAAFDVHLKSADCLSFNENIRDYVADKRMRFCRA
jgi:quinol monooxygenase YgiN